MEPPAEAAHIAPAALAEPPPPPRAPPPPPDARCSPADAGMPCDFALLEPELMRAVLAAVPADVRAVCARVCAPWREALVRGDDAWRLWTRLDLSPSSGVACIKTDTVLTAAAAMAGGRLQELDLSVRVHTADTPAGAFQRSLNHYDRITFDALLRVVRSNVELHELTLHGVDGSLVPDHLQQLLTFAPTLHTLDAVNVRCESSASSLPLLRAEPPYGPLRMRGLHVACSGFGINSTDIGTVVGARAFASAVAQARMRVLRLSDIQWSDPAALEALVDALLARTCHVEQLTLTDGYRLSPAYLPAFACLLAGRKGASLTSVTVLHAGLYVKNYSRHSGKLHDALRRSQLTHVRLPSTGLTKKNKRALRAAAAAAPRHYLDLF